MTARAIKPHTYRAWLIVPAFLGGWEATHPDYDPDHRDDGPADNRSVTGRTIAEVHHEIDLWLEEYGE